MGDGEKNKMGRKVGFSSMIDEWLTHCHDIKHYHPKQKVGFNGLLNENKRKSSLIWHFTISLKVYKANIRSFFV